MGTKGKQRLPLPLLLALGLNQTPFESKRQQEADRGTDTKNSNIKRRK